MTLPPRQQDCDDGPETETETETEYYEQSEGVSGRGNIVDITTTHDSNKLSGATSEGYSKDMDIFSFYLGQLIDVLDSVDRWSEAEVLKIDRQNNRIFVSFLYWQSKWDMWIDNIHERTAPLHTHTYVHPGPPRLGQRLNVYDQTTHKWLEAYVIEETQEEVKVHYRNFSPKFDEWIPLPHIHRFRQYGPDKNLQKKVKQWAVPEGIREEDDVRLLIAHKNAQDGYDRPGSASSMERKKLGSKGSSRESKSHKTDSTLNQQRQRQITEFSERYQHYIHALEEQGLEVHAVEGDGNCLFRAVAHQVYGEERFHEIVREKCMDYMESQAEFYCQFVVGGMETFPLYVAAKRQNGCWGDDPEIQAMCEMYGRPAYIWAYDAVCGAKNLRTFHEAAEVHGSVGDGIIRLSYYGGGHYDSIHKIGTFGQARVRNDNQENTSSNTEIVDTFIRLQPGILEETAIRRVSQRHQNSNLQTLSSSNEITNSVLAQELAQVAEAKRVSEQEASDLDLDLAIRASRHGITYWAEDDIESCLLTSMAMSTAEEKTGTSSSNSRPSSKSSSRKESQSGSIGISPRPEAPKRQKKEGCGEQDDALSLTSPRSESKVSSSDGTVLRAEEEVISESLRVHDEKQLETARVLSDQELLDQALKASLEESYQKQYDDQQYESMLQGGPSGDVVNLYGVDEGEDELQKALALSFNATTTMDPQDMSANYNIKNDELDLQNALQMSLAATSTSSNPSASQNTSQISTSTETFPISAGGIGTSDEYTNMLMFEGEDDPELALALQFSLQEK